MQRALNEQINKTVELERKLIDHRHAVAAYALDRSQQYEEDSGSRCALEQFAISILNGEHIKALEHGELDDLMAWARGDTRARKLRPKIAPPKRDSSGGYDVPEPEVPCPCCENLPRR